MTTCNNTLLFRPVRLLASGLMLLVCTLTYSQTIIIGGDIYGGGRQGAVGTSKVDTVTSPNYQSLKEGLTLNESALENGTYTTQIKINTGTVRTVFGGGQNGRTYGNTNVIIQGDSTKIGSEDWQGSIYGGVFGAGDGESAYVFGNSNLNIKGGTINQNVYGGGNRADLMGTSTVVLCGGTLKESLFGGARLANIFGYSFVNIDGAQAANDLIVKAIYGGNDIAGNISSSSQWTWTSSSKLTLPSVLGYANSTTQNIAKFKAYNAFVYSSPEQTGSNAHHVFIGQVFGGGNGDYTYATKGDSLEVTALWKKRTGTQGSYVYTKDTSTVKKKPEVERVYLELKGGTYGYVYGGGNAATVTEDVDICLNNQTQDIYSVNLQTLENMGLDYDTEDSVYTVTGTTHNDSTLKSKYQFDRVFGGNNKATMDKQPSWHITKATINNLYSGGNAGSMTYYRGLLLTLTSPDLEVNNVYGGCRRADVIPDVPQGEKIAAMTNTVDGFKLNFPEDLSAHILITAGKINNVYGGNDISGKVRGGNGIDIRSSIIGDVYGGGNGSYLYTDNPDLRTHPKYKDFYYVISDTLTGTPAIKSAKALNQFRPNAEQAWISVLGTVDNPTVIGGSLYCGGNSATLDIDPSEADSKHATLKIGSYVIAQNVFLGSNGKNMIDDGMLAMYDNGNVNGKTFSNIDFHEDGVFDEYIKGVSVGIRPEVTFYDTYAPDSTLIGSLFFGGNLGSVTAGGTFDVRFAKNLVIFDKIVAGCNDANYKNDTYGIDYVGGITTAPASGQDKIIMTLNKITLKPGKIAYDDNKKPYIDWNVENDRLVGGNIFGGCYTSGIINGNVVINLTSAAYDDAKVFGDGKSGVDHDDQLNDVFSTALSIFGGGYGANAEIRGNTTVNISGSGHILKVFGGGLQGPINGNTTINLTGGTVGNIYGGGFEGRINGYTTVNLNGGEVYSAFGGACNANIRDYTQVFIGSGAADITTVKNNVYGGNDFGGRIEGTGDFSGTRYVTTTESANAYNQDVLKSSTYVEYVQGNIANNIFGGSCGSYSYTGSPYIDHIIEDNGNPNSPLPYLTSSFVHFKGNNAVLNSVKQVFGASEGKEGSDASDNIQDKMQQRSYVLVNATVDSTFNKTDIFGAGAYSGLGMDIAQSNRNQRDLDNHSSIVDLMGGWIKDAYGASYNEGVTRRTVVNVPTGSTARMSNLFGGGYGSKLTSPCDVYESHVNWNSGAASCRYLYGGNNNCRRVLYTFVNINEQAWSNKSSGFLTTVYGAGCGPDTWAEYTYVNLNDKALVYEVYGGGYGGKVLNLESVNAWKAQTENDTIDNNELYTTIGSGYIDYGLSTDDATKEPLVAVNGLGYKTNTNVFINKGAVVGLRSDRRSEGIYPVTIKGGYGYAGGYGDNDLDDGFDESIGSVCGTTYIGLHGGIVWKDMYAGGTLGSVYDGFKTKAFTAQSNAFVEGGSTRNVYGAGWKGRIGYTELPVTVDLNQMVPDSVLKKDIPGESNVYIGVKPELKSSYTAAGRTWGFYDGEPTVERNAYSSGEDGGAVIGTAHMTVYGGYVGYRYAALNDPSNIVDHYFNPGANDDGSYLESTYDETWTFDTEHPNPEDGKDRLLDAGSVFGGGYTDNATADNTIVTVWGGHIRNSVYGGGEVAAIGRGEANETVGSALRTLKGIYKSGSTKVYIYSGNIDRNVFGGGKGYNNNGTKGSLLTDGYVFGTTEVYIYGGEIGTPLTVLEGDGNVFGGGNIGYVYNSRNSKKFTGTETDSVGIGYYYQIDDKDDFIYNNSEKLLSEDCKVVVTPYSMVLDANGVTINGTHFNQYDFVPTDYLNKLRKDDSRWHDHNTGTGELDQTGITIHNAIFAGGNVSSGNELYANTKTVFGNATATINDLYYCDLITVGTEHIGGLYGDGNLTRVDGYRELNITNYGTDYYGMNTDRVTLEDYHKMNDRERAYFQLKYVLKEQIVYGNNTYGEGTIKTKDEIKDEFPNGSTAENGKTIVDADGTPDSTLWDEYGFVSIYAGRLINTIQRADFCGVFGSRMVMQGARDRVPETVDFTDYTINRVGEISLNRVENPNGDKDTLNNTLKNGNYFGIYNIVNHLAAITSDIDFAEERVTAKTEDSLYLPKNSIQESFYGWKYANKLNRRRNDGEADNKVALASGVYLEITTEESTQDNKIWGPITGILELDLINVMPGMGGGYVYAKNEHGRRDTTGLKHITLSPYNKNAVSNKKYKYTKPTIDDDFQTSGNLVSSKTIIDDCYPTSDSYLGDDAATGHYWYIKGEIYVYDLYLSAYTGAASAYSKTVSIPLTITAGSHGVITLQDVKPNKFMYYGADNATPLGADEKIIINNITYQLNDSISYWDWLQLADNDKEKFVDTTYVTIADCLVDQDTISKGYVLSAKDYKKFYNTLDENKTVHHLTKNVDVPVTDIFRLSNDMSHNKGYALTLDMNNPEAWNNYYMPASGTGKTTTPTSGYLKSPTYQVENSGIYGQRDYGHGDIITKDIYDTYQALRKNHLSLVPRDSAVFEPAYVMTEDWSVEQNENIRYFNKGLVMPKSEYTANGIGNKAGPALFCIETWKLSAANMYDEYIFYGTSITEQEIRDLAGLYNLTEQQITDALSTYFAPAYYCTTAGKYGGNYYEQGNNYPTRTAWSAMNPEDRPNFKFNYDALDILIDSTFSGRPLLYDGIGLTESGTYSSAQPIDYTAKCISEDGVTYTDTSNTSRNIAKNAILNRADYEALPNEQYHYSPFRPTNGTAYIVKNPFTIGNKSYSIGNVISFDTYDHLSADNKQKIDVLTNMADGKYYYCRESYVIGANGSESGKSSTINNIRVNHGETTITTGSVIPGIVITEANYNNLPNVQKDFSIHGKTPVGVSTLYVSGQSNILDLSKGRIYTVTYNYDYEESDDEGNNINQVNEKHVINIHVQFQGGTPTISPIANPATVLPGSTVGITQPRVTPGAYEVIGGGWEMFQTYEDAVNHVNGAEYDNGRTVLYWYNNNYYLAYYAKTYLGKTYSNEVPIKVGNYHDLSRVMRDTLHHMYVDHPNVKHNSKIYISGNKYNTVDPKNATKNELDLLKDFYDLSLVQLDYDSNNDPIAISGGIFDKHIPMNDHVKGGANLDFIIKTDLSPMAYTDWTPIGSSTQCFEGTLHGDGHTISGLNNSLFSYLCGDVYNLGVTGTFTGAGIADNGGGHIENAWINTTGTITANTKPVFGGDGTVVNAYYPAEITGYASRDGVTARPMTAFHNGEVAYDLNGFYLTKRKAIKTNDANDNKYYYTITDNANNILSNLPTGYVEATDYVAKRYADGDFIYASGSIPDQTSERMFYKEPADNEQPDPKNNRYFPIYPDDYIFFGQMLTYGYSNITGEAYQEYPSSINRDNRNAAGTQRHATQWIAREEVNSSNSIKSNRVYRAPAYFGNSTMSVAHFNANAFLPAKTRDGQIDVYPGMTALDLTGDGDNTWSNGWTQDSTFFMTRLLDFNALTGFRSDGQTRNLLVYSKYNDKASNSILRTYLADQDWDYSNNNYKTVPVLDDGKASRVKGHLITLANNVYQADTSQYLVDRQDFNAPISYTFIQGDYMWYQRVPEHYVESSNAGWEAISLPFTAQYVTTQEKGEITHFYSGSKTGHEYWLREYKEIESQTQNQTVTVMAMFSTPAADEGYNKIYGNTFLWDYYYKNANGNDINTDKYFQTYYNEANTYEDYPLYAAGTPYLIGFPGKRYYEFDLSGQFEAQYTASQPLKLDGPQVITFISSDAGTTIQVTDDEYEDNLATNDGYVYIPNYKTQTVNAYMLNNTGDSFVYTENAQTVPFRAYMATASSLAQRRAGTRADALYIGYLGDTDPLVETPVQRGLNIYSEHLNIIIENVMTEPATVTITTTAGRRLKQFVIQPGTKVTVPVNSRGIYIVNRQKIAVTR